MCGIICSFMDNILKVNIGWAKLQRWAWLELKSNLPITDLICRIHQWGSASRPLFARCYFSCCWFWRFHPRASFVKVLCNVLALSSAATMKVAKKAASGQIASRFSWFLGVKSLVFQPLSLLADHFFRGRAAALLPHVCWYCCHPLCLRSELAKPIYNRFSMIKVIVVHRGGG